MARFQPGDLVLVRDAEMDSHHRTPAYIKGRVGRVQALSGLYPNPESLAYGADGQPELDLYLVEFDMRDLWGERANGPSGDRLLVDVYEHWLEAAEAVAEAPASDGGEA